MTDRVAQVAWIRAHLDDLDADFARYYRVDLYDLDGPRLCTRAERVFAYGGVMAIRLAEQEAPEVDETLPDVPDGAQHVPVSAMADLIEM